MVVKSKSEVFKTIKEEYEGKSEIIPHTYHVKVFKTAKPKKFIVNMTLANRPEFEIQEHVLNWDASDEKDQTMMTKEGFNAYFKHLIHKRMVFAPFSTQEREMRLNEQIQRKNSNRDTGSFFQNLFADEDTEKSKLINMGTYVILSEEQHKEYLDELSLEDPHQFKSKKDLGNKLRRGNTIADNLAGYSKIKTVKI